MAGLALAQQDTIDPERENQDGLFHLQKSRFIDAIAAFRKAVAMKPDFVRAWTNLGSALAQAGEMEDSVAAFRKSVALDAKDPQLRMNLGIALRAKGDADAALTEFRAVLLSRPADPEIRQQLAMTLKQQGNLTGAIEAFESVLNLNPEHREAYYNLGVVLRQQAASLRRRSTKQPDATIETGLRLAKEMLVRGDLKGARSEVEKLQRSAPASAEVLNLLGFVQGQERDLPASVATLRRAVDLDPSMPEARYNLGVALWYSGEKAAALESLQHSVRLNPAAAEVHAFLGMATKDRQALQRAIALNPNLSAPYIDLSMVLLQAGKIDQAIGQIEAALNLRTQSIPIADLDVIVSELRRVLSVKQGYPEARNILGLLLGKQGADPKQVMAEFREAIRLRPEYAEAHNNLGLVLMQVGQNESGIAEFREALRLAPRYASALGNLGAALVASKPEEAIELLEKAVAADPAFVRAQYNLALAYAQSPKHGADRAIVQFRKAIDLEPDFAAAHFEFGKVLFRENALNDAISHFREAVKLDPKLGAARYQLGLALTRAGQRAEGTAELEKARPAIEDEQKLTIAGQLMGEARAALENGQSNAAVASLQNVVRLVPDYAPARESLQRALAAASPADDPRQVAIFEDYIRKQRFEELEPLVVNYLKAWPKSSWGHYVLGYALFGQRRIGDSITALAKSLELNVANADAHRLLGRSLMVIGRYDAARTEMEQASRLRPQWPEVHYDLGKIHSANDDYPPARREFEEAIRLNPQYMEAFEALGFVMEASGDDEAALALYRKSAEINDARQASFASPYISLAAYYNRAGNPTLALENARKALQVDLRSDGGNFQLAKALDRLHQWPEAAEALKRAIEANPRAASYHYVLSGVYRQLGKAQESQAHLDTFQKLEKEAAEFEQKRREARLNGGASPAKAPPPRQQ